MAPGTFPGVSRTVVRVSTDDGFVGLGECGSAEDAAAVRDAVGPPLLGRELAEALDELDVTGPGSVEHRSDGRVVFGGGRAGIEMALYDAQARAAGVPLHTLLGGACRTEVEFSEYFALREGREQSVDDVASYCARMVAEHGSQMFEGKVAVRSLEEETRLVGAVREAIGPQRRLRLDANMGWSLETAGRALDAFAEFEIENIEEPVATFEEMAVLRRRSAIPFSSHTPDLTRATRLGVPDAFVLGLGACGGIGGTRRFIAACERHGVGFWFYSGDLGIATAAYLHIAAASPYLRWPSQSLLRWMTDDVVVGGPVSPEVGVLPVPMGPGLGVELDEDALERCAERHAREGSYDYYSERLPRY